VVARSSPSPSHRLWIGGFVLLMASGGFFAGRVVLRTRARVIQPVEFNHRLHVEGAGIECLLCHEYYQSGESSGLPSAGLCLECHEGGLTESPEEQKLLDLAGSESGLHFEKLFRMPDHVYYSHRTHVVVAGLECEECHGGIAETTAPPPTALVRITMDTCVDCHAEQGVRTDCTHCHR
jgi:predicted CXXCH cytochrome family protein